MAVTLSEKAAKHVASYMAKRGKGKKYHSGVHPFSSKIRCGQCGSWYGSKVWHSTDKYRRTIWQCNHKYDGGKHCCTPHLTDEQIQDAFLSAANQLLAIKDAVIANGREMMELLFDTSEQEAERDKLLEEAQVVSDAVQQNIYENAHVALDQKAYQKKYDEVKTHQHKRALALTARKFVRLIFGLLANNQLYSATRVNQIS